MSSVARLVWSVYVLLYSSRYIDAMVDGFIQKELHIGGLFPMSGGWAGGQGCQPAVKMALEDVNSQTDLLPGYMLNLTVKDTQCLPGLGLNKMYELVYHPDTKVILLAGCSGVSTFVAQAARMWNLIVLAYGSSSPALSNRERFPTFFRTHPSATLHNPTRVKLFQHWKWSRVATIQQTEEVFTSTIEDLEERVKDAGIDIDVRASFLTDPTNAVRNLKRQDARIIVGVFYEDMARRVICQAYREKLYGKRYVWFLIGWYPDNWYMERDPHINCTKEQMREVLDGHFTTEAMVLYREEHKLTDTGITAANFSARLNAKLNFTDPTKIAGYPEAPLAYDAVWALAFALKKSIVKLASMNLSLEDFTYTSKDIADVIYAAMNETKFLGVSGPVSFNAEGDRIAWTQIEQMIDGQYRKIGFYDDETDDLQWSKRSKVTWRDGSPPPDRTKIQHKLRLISLDNYVALCILALIGIVGGATGLAFTYKHSERRVIIYSQPVMNTVAVLGFIICLCSVFLHGLDGRYLSEVQIVRVCQVDIWFLCVGFTLSYGAMFSKIAAVHRWTTRGKKTNQEIQTWELLMVVGVLLVVDITILVVWHVIDPVYMVYEYFPLEDPHTKEDVMIQPKLQHCTANHRTIWIGVMFAYKGLLALFGILLAYETRSIKVKQVNDCRFVGMGIYNVTVMSFITAPVMLIIGSQENASYTFLSLAIILCSYISIGLIYVPKVISIRKYTEDVSEREHLKNGVVNEDEHLERLAEENKELKDELAEKENILRSLQKRIHDRSQHLEARVSYRIRRKSNSQHLSPGNGQNSASNSQSSLNFTVQDLNESSSTKNGSNNNCTMATSQKQDESTVVG